MKKISLSLFAGSLLVILAAFTINGWLYKLRASDGSIFGQFSADQ